MALLFYKKDTYVAIEVMLIFSSNDSRKGSCQLLAIVWILITG